LRRCRSNEAICNHGRLAGTCLINPATSPVSASLKPNGARSGTSPEVHKNAGRGVGSMWSAPDAAAEGGSNMADKLNSMKVRLCAVVWDLLEMGFFEGRRAMTVLNRIENMEFREIAEWMGVLLPEAHREGRQ